MRPSRHSVYPLRDRSGLRCSETSGSPARVRHLLRPLLTSASRSGLLRVPQSGWTRCRSPEVSLTAFPAHLPNLQPWPWWTRTSQIRACSSGQDCLIFGFCPSGRGFASTLLSDGSSRRPPLRFANPLSHQTWVEDFHLQAVKHARHTRRCGRQERAHKLLGKRTERVFHKLPQPSSSDPDLEGFDNGTGASRLAALLLLQILPVFSVVAPCHPGAALRDLVLVQRGQATSRQKGCS